FPLLYKRFTRNAMKLSLFFLIAIILLFLGCFVLAVDTAVAQDASLGAIHGRVFDPNGHALAGARVLVRQSSRGVELTTTADEDGAFAFGLLRPGEYEVSAESDGMARRSARNVRVEVGAIAELEL